ncbi:MAG: proton-conducting transporter membrane subunit [Cytophagales bacterium]
MNITDWINNDLSIIFPETAAVILFVIWIILAAFLKKNRVLKPLFTASIAFLLFVNINQFLEFQNEEPVHLFFEHLTLSSSRIFYKILATFVILLYALYIRNFSIKRSDKFAEKYLVIIAQLLGAYIAIQASSYLTLFLGLEIVSITSYFLVYFSFNISSQKAALKYFLFGAFSSALMIYGISWIYGITGNIFLGRFEQTDTHFSYIFSVLALVCLYAGLFFKIAVVPFHLWTEDVYKGVHNSILSVISLLPKLVGIVALFHILESFRDFPFLNIFSEILIYFVSISTMLLANLTAIRQTQFKSLFAYSSIAQSGVFLSLIPMNSETNFIFYFIIYIFANFAFLFIHQTLCGEKQEELESLSGLGIKKPFLGICYLITMGSLIGIPVFSGFTAKLLVVQSLLQNFSFYYISSWVGLVVLLTTFISLFYYLRIPYYLFVKKYNNSIVDKLRYNQVLFSAFLVLPLIIGFFSFDWLLGWLQSLN